MSRGKGTCQREQRGRTSKSSRSEKEWKLRGRWAKAGEKPRRRVKKSKMQKKGTTALAGVVRCSSSAWAGRCGL
ncbi:hypothetical protein GGTG_13981 [Gaeumannomyces tritici R3-111a-1]|uniref:Uncharacterized protein n=1 Tax=Gaeumannomyces tritici (strain R3-111a-1) TaxID=644352 RepID=J3PKC7_GAET3|nr:hypothetical protein GGTG_13981 [Gaeumannomyces tritici R3-111a-1]EJT68441.1 hypothetical protein GGTG_13981 [Gaeumannomyces tritici R3-111a-1]